MDCHSITEVLKIELKQLIEIHNLLSKMWRFVPSWLMPPASDQMNDDAPTSPYEHGKPAVLRGAAQAHGERRSSVMQELNNLIEMMSGLMAELRREESEDSECPDDLETDRGKSDICREILGNPPTMQPLDLNDESSIFVPRTL